MLLVKKAARKGKGAWIDAGKGAVSSQDTSLMNIKTSQDVSKLLRERKKEVVILHVILGLPLVLPTHVAFRLLRVSDLWGFAFQWHDQSVMCSPHDSSMCLIRKPPVFPTFQTLGGPQCCPADTMGPHLALNTLRPAGGGIRTHAHDRGGIA